MKYYLVDRQNVHLPCKYPFQGSRGCELRRYNDVITLEDFIEHEISSFHPCNRELSVFSRLTLVTESEEGRQQLADLKIALQNGRGNGWCGEDMLQITLIPQFESSSAGKVTIKVEGSILEHLVKQFGVKNVELKVELTNLQGLERGRGSLSRMVNALAAPPHSHPDKASQSAVFQATNMIIPHHLIRSWRKGYELSGVLTVEVALHGDDADVSDKLSINRKILDEEIASDVDIVTGDGTVVKCHKNFLAAQSPVFDAMFKSNLKETQTSTIEMPDISERGVRAFLKYLYYWDTKEATKTSDLAFELLQAGHKYDIGSLEKCMRRTFLKKAEKWFTVDVALELFLFSRNMDDREELKLKAIQVLKANVIELEGSPNYQKLFREAPEAAMELCRYAFNC